MEWLTYAIITGVIGGIVANHKGRNVAGWSILCFLFGIFPLIVLAFLPSLCKRAAEATAVVQNTNQNATNVVVNIPGFVPPYGVPQAPAGYTMVPQVASQQMLPNGQPAPVAYTYPAPVFAPVASIQPVPGAEVPTPPRTPEPPAPQS
jgi:hypothetical protein